MAAATAETRVEFLQGDAPAVRYTSGLTIYDESLHHGRLIGRYWSTNGRVRPDMFHAATLERVEHLPVEAFALEIDGQSLHSHWEWGDARLESASDDANATTTQQVVVELHHRVRPVTVRVRTRLDGTPILTRTLEIVNTGDRPAALSRVRPFGGLLWRITNVRNHLPAGVTSAFTLGRFQSSQGLYEGFFGWEPIPNATLRIEGRKGRSGHGAPFFVVKNEANGDFAVCHIAWSANWSYELIADQDPALPDAVLCFQAGPEGRAPLRVIAPGEAVETPAVHLGVLHADFDGAIQALHDHIRRSVLPPQPEGRAQRFIHNHWGYVADRVNDEFLKRDIDLAAEAGVELYILDAGWYGSEPGRWYHTVGDWQSGEWLSGGVRAIREYARSKGLLFGLWMEAECVGSLSKVYQEHPDWVMQRDGRPVVRHRGEGQHYVLDLAKPEVAQWVETQIHRVIEEFDLDLFRLDYNIDPYEGGQTIRDGYVENSLWRQVQALYDIFDRVRARYPRLILENCSSGGGRTDLGILGRFHTTWTSDLAQLPRALGILNGMTMALPPEVCSRIAGYMNGEELFHGDVDFQFRVPLFGHPVMVGIAPSVAEFNPGHRARLERAIELYRDVFRPLLPTAKVFHHTPVVDFTHPQGYCVLEYAAPDGSRAVAGIFRLAGGEEEYHFRPRGIHRGRRYRVTFDNALEVIEVEGRTLANEGLRIRLESPLRSELLIFEAI